MTKDYTADDIKILTDREHVRIRTQVYLGNTTPTTYDVPLFTPDGFMIEPVTFIPAVYKAVGEIIDNSIDEFAHTPKRKLKALKMEVDPAEGRYSISDNGRGIPIEKHASGKYTPEVALGSLRSGRNFEQELDAGVIGQNGVGSACTNFCSSEFKVEIARDRKKYTQTFVDGALHVSNPTIRATKSTKTGTSISFKLDDQVFERISLPIDLLRNRAIEVALTNPEVTVSFNGHAYRYAHGFDDIIKQISGQFFKFVFKQNGISMEFYVLFDAEVSQEEKVFTWVNSSFLFDGGLCNTQFINAFSDKVAEHLESQAKKYKCTVTKNDIRANLVVFGNLRLSSPLYDAQSKTRLTGPNLRKEIVKCLEDGWSSFARQNRDWFDSVLERSIIRHHSTANKKAVKDHRKGLNRKIPNLIDATGRNRFDCQLLVTEGDSAASMITQARDPKTIASLPLRGKINNVHGKTIAQLLKMGKVADLITAIGLVPGQKALRSSLNYGKVVIATDADYDGGDIFTLIVNLLFSYWPELFDPNYESFVYRLIAPNVCATKGKTRVHFPSRDDFEKSKTKYKNWNIAYYKGLGSMVKQDWQMILSGTTNTLIPILNDGKMDDTLELLFGHDANARKEWLQQK